MEYIKEGFLLTFLIFCFQNFSKYYSIYYPADA